MNVREFASGGVENRSLIVLLYLQVDREPEINIVEIKTICHCNLIPSVCDAPLHEPVTFMKVLSPSFPLWFLCYPHADLFPRFRR